MLPCLELNSGSYLSRCGNYTAMIRKLGRKLNSHVQLSIPRPQYKIWSKVVKLLAEICLWMDEIELPIMLFICHCLCRVADLPQSRHYEVLGYSSMCDFEKSIIDNEIFTRLLRQERNGGRGLKEKSVVFWSDLGVANCTWKNSYATDQEVKGSGDNSWYGLCSNLPRSLSCFWWPSWYLCILSIYVKK